MANYNPHAPYILGQEWVPIRQADYTPDDNITERGYTFQIETAVTPVTGAYYISEIPSNQVSQVCDFIAVYPAGRETLTGPIKKVYIPASAVAATGPQIDVSAGAAALANPSDGLTIRFDAPGGSDELRVNFDVAAYTQQLFGKRILDVTIRYIMVGDPVEGQQLLMYVDQIDVVGDRVLYADTLEVAAGFVTANPVKQQMSFVTLTDLNPFWDTAVEVNNQRNILPWRFQELNLFRSGAPVNDRLVIAVSNNVAASSVFLTFMDMQVTYCEETRVRYGGRRTENLNATAARDAYTLGQNIVRLYDTSFVTTASLAAGDYTVTLKHVNLADIFSTLVGEPRVRAVRGYYDLPDITPVRVKTSLVEGDTFTVADEGTVLTHLTLHTASAIVTGVHAYGTSYGAPVYGTITAVQEIEDDPVGTARTYPQVRFYARRYGNTTVPLTLADVATGLSTVSITVAEFDALEEIVDGWREVTLRFVTPPSFVTAAGDVDWRWSATGELAGNQWQIMVADGPSTSVTTPPSLATALATGPATYYAPQGDTVTLTWQSPAISGVGEDSTSDAVLIFSEDPPTVTGFTLQVLSQEITGIGLDCDTLPDCIATGIYYIDMSWEYGTVCTDDDIVLTSLATDTGTTYDVDPPQADLIIRGTYYNRDIPVGGNIEIKIAARYVDTANFVQVRLFLLPGNTVTTSVRQVIAGVETNGGFPTVPNITTTDRVDFIFYVVGATLQFKAWVHGTPEPVAWATSLTTTMLTPGDVRFAGELSGPVTNPLPITVEIDNVIAAPPAAEGTYHEIQRFDTYDGAWKTIMQSTTPCANEFADYEARVGVESQYRIRTCNVLDFCGAWVTGSATIPTPGVTGAGDGNSILILTSNAAPDAALAYVMQWENQPVETFAFPEADFVQLQRLFGRDYFTAFYPLERGGDQFTRILLVNAAAITPQALANFSDLRDLAWAQLDYVCVRDELGNRWLANIRVPDGAVRRDRTLYLAQIQVAQVTDTPTPIDPGA